MCQGLEKFEQKKPDGNQFPIPVKYEVKKICTTDKACLRI